MKHEGIHTSLVITVRENEKHVLQNGNIELLEEYTRRLNIGLGHVVHQFKAHGETCVFHFTVVVFTGPHARVDHELELRCIQFKQSREAIQIDRLEQLKELNSVFWVFMEILVDHLKCGFENAFHDKWYLVFHQGLEHM